MIQFAILIVSLLAGPETLRGKVVSISDGDTVRVLVGTTQHKIRLAEIDAPEKGQAFGKNRPPFTPDRSGD